MATTTGAAAAAVSNSGIDLSSTTPVTFQVVVGGLTLDAVGGSGPLVAAPATDLLALGGTGNSSIDASAATGPVTVIANTGNNAITLGAAPALVNPGAGNDTVNLGTGAATIDITGTGQGNDTVVGFKPTTAGTTGDKIVLSDKSGDGQLTPEDLTGVQQTSPGVVTLTFADGSSVTLQGVNSAGNPLTPQDINFVISPDGAGSITTRAAGSENVSMSTGTLIKGTTGNDTIYNNSANNIIDGGAGNDTFMVHKMNQGHDTYINLNVGDRMLITDRNGDGKLDVNDLAAKDAIVDGDAGTTITFADGSSVTLEGVHVKTLDELHARVENIDGTDYGVLS